ncbi:MAG: helix-turn-helix domain-containing protein [Alphaproteobacteria bacterium]|nr:helix-turn-helix domain-containing protein [Alphaproteobacteria bacterium]
MAEHAPPETGNFRAIPVAKRVFSCYRLCTFVHKPSPKKPTWQGRLRSERAVAQPKGLSPAEIKFQLTRRGITFAALDREAGLPPGTCRNAARRPHRAGEAAIAAAMGRPPRMIWPGRYHVDGSRISPQPGSHYRPAPQFGHRQNGARA